MQPSDMKLPYTYFNFLYYFCLNNVAKQMVGEYRKTQQMLSRQLQMRESHRGSSSLFIDFVLIILAELPSHLLNRNTSCLSGFFSCDTIWSNLPIFDRQFLQRSPTWKLSSMLCCYRYPYAIALFNKINSSYLKPLCVSWDFSPFGSFGVIHIRRRLSIWLQNVISLNKIKDITYELMISVIRIIDIIKYLVI